MNIREQFYKGILDSLTALQKGAVTEFEREYVTEAIEKVVKARQSAEGESKPKTNVLQFRPRQRVVFHEGNDGSVV